MPEDQLPAPGGPPLLDRAGLERVLARATELHAAVGERPESLSEEQLIEIGSEVGIAPQHLRQALAEERGRGLLPPERGAAVVLAGASSVAVARVVNGTPSAVLAALDATMQRDEVLAPRRRFPEKLTWEAQRGLLGGLRRGLSLGGRAYHLAGASEVSASVAAVDSGRVHVRLVASFAETRRRRLEITLVASGLILLASVPLAMIGVAPLLAVLPPLGVSSALLGLVRRQYRRFLESAHVALEQVLDRLEYGAPRPTAAQSIFDALVGPPRLPPPGKG